jgi:hypothetical protein
MQEAPKRVVEAAHQVENGQPADELTQFRG